MHAKFSRTWLPRALSAWSRPRCRADARLAPQRPTPGLFGSAPRGDQTFDISASLIGAYEDNVVPGTEPGAGSLDGTAQEGGSYNGLTTGVTLREAVPAGVDWCLGWLSASSLPRGITILSAEHYVAAAGLAVQLNENAHQRHPTTALLAVLFDREWSAAVRARAGGVAGEQPRHRGDPSRSPFVRLERRSGAVGRSTSGTRVRCEPRTPSSS